MGVTMAEPHMTREELIVAAEIAFERLMTPTRGLPPELMEESMAEGEWSFKDLAAQLVFWDGLVLRALEDLNYGRQFDWSPYRIENGWNAQAVERLQPQNVKRVLTEMRLTHSTLTEALRRIPDENLLMDDQLPPWLIENLAGRYERYIPQVENWAKRMRQEGRALPPLPILGGK